MPILGTMTGQELRRWRLAAGLTQADLAGRLTCSRRAVQEWEAGGLLLKRVELAVHGLSMHLAAERRDTRCLTAEAVGLIARMMPPPTASASTLDF